MRNIVIATIRDWNISNVSILENNRALNSYKFHTICENSDLTVDLISSLNPEYIFFPHWSWIINPNIYENYKCVVFHMTDLPFGRGGSPLQNLIIRGIETTKITALKVSNVVDGGDIYCKETLDINEGSAQFIFEKASNIIFSRMIPKILIENITPEPQVGEVISFKRRSPADSEMKLSKTSEIRDAYNFIRMLDADGYPRAFIKLNDNLVLELKEGKIVGETLIGEFEIKNV